MVQRYVTIQRVSVLITDDDAIKVFGHVLNLPGGTEIEATDGTLDGQLVLNDPHLPAISAQRFMALTQFAFRPLAEDERGPRVGKPRIECEHNLTRRDGREDGCLACYYRTWTRRAADLGITLAAQAAPKQESESGEAIEPRAQTDGNGPKRKRRSRKSKAEL